MFILHKLYNLVVKHCLLSIYKKTHPTKTQNLNNFFLSCRIELKFFIKIFSAQKTQLWCWRRNTKISGKSKCRNFETRNWGWMSQNEILKIRVWETKCTPFNSAPINRSTFSNTTSLTRKKTGSKMYYPLFFRFLHFCPFFRHFDMKTKCEKMILTNAIEQRILYRMTERLWNLDFPFGSYGPPKCQNLPKNFWQL